jgi:hypothetical protein
LFGSGAILSVSITIIGFQVSNESFCTETALSSARYILNFDWLIIDPSEEVTAAVNFKES